MQEYIDADSSLTLGEAIQKMRALEPEDFVGKTSIDVVQLVEQHDAVHILFDCGTSIQDEIAVHVWMIFATTASMSDMHRAVANQEHRTALSGMGHLKLISVWVLSLPRIIGILLKSLKMKKRIAMEELSGLKGQFIFEIRREHGIVL
ncbi:hypothetical protein IQ254_00240 [Nodosilinea sp. LEGE 07088]|uniref:hypothetical protein n=1 Tax=Nodosilinea sp. LEGE 07088 TaxID=2777968 RepID=UPI00187FD9CC|nr:hypothetical protein [Nodosilinea sp. LEGE 07088]MBE9135648.1 hypothetical protein [Nodosilinea sp. LEGE 07088]